MASLGALAVASASACDVHTPDLLEPVAPPVPPESGIGWRVTDGVIAGRSRAADTARQATAREPATVEPLGECAPRPRRDGGL